MQRATPALCRSSQALALPLLWLACSGTSREVSESPLIQVVENPTSEPAAPSEADGGVLPPAAPPPQCVPVTRVPAAQERTSLGVSPAEMLAWLSGEHQEALAWQDEAGSFAAEPGSTLTIRVQPKPDGVRWIVSNADDPLAGFCEARNDSYGDISTTFDELRFDVSLQLSTSGGELSETLDATLVADASDFATTIVELPARALAGRLSTDASTVYLRLGISPFGNVGQLYLSQGEALGAGSYVPRPEGVVARFPARDFCGPTYVTFGDSDRVRGVTVAEVFERLNAFSPIDLDDSAGTLSWSFAATERRGCMDLGSPARLGGVVSIPARATMRSSDQRVDGSFDVNVYGGIYNGVLRAPHADTQLEFDDPARAAAAAARDFGIQPPLDFTGYQRGRLEFRNEISGDTSTGSLRAVGINPPSESCTSTAYGSMCSASSGYTDLFVLSWAGRRR
jgi:hypothetical protein